MMLRRADIPFGEEPVRLLPWLVGMLVWIGVLALFSVLAVHGTAGTWRSGLTGSLTIELPPAGPDAAAVSATSGLGMAAALAVLRSDPAIAAAEPVAPADIAAMLEPWVGDPALVLDLPIPQLIDVTLRPGTPIDLGRLAERLAAAVPGSAIDDHGARAGPVLAILDAVEALVAFVAAVVVAAVAMIVVIATRAALAVHHGTIEVLRLIGARDDEIAGRYGAQAFRQAFAGGCGGAALAAVTILVLAAVMPASGSREVISAGGGVWWLLAAAPVAIAVLGMAAARLAVLRRLKASF